MHTGNPLIVESLEPTMKVVTFEAERAEPVYREFGFNSKEEFFEALLDEPGLRELAKALESKP